MRMSPRTFLSRQWVFLIAGLVCASATRTTSTTTTEHGHVQKLQQLPPPFQQKQQQTQQQQKQRNLQSLTVSIVDATANFVKSTESRYDHEIQLNNHLSFHWNDPTVGTLASFDGRLIHKVETLSQAPSWLGFGIYKDNHNYTALPIANFMIGSDAIIGTVQAETPDTPVASVQKYHLGSRELTTTTSGTVGGSGGIRPIGSTAVTTLRMANILQHDSDDGTVTTDLTFTKLLDEPNLEEIRLRRDGVNVFLWAVGSPPASGSDGTTTTTLSKHADKGVFYLDFQAVQTAVESASTSTTTTPVGGGGGSGDTSSSSTTGTTTTTTTTDTTTTTTGTVSTGSTALNTSPVIAGQCGSPLFPGGAHVALTPLLTFHWLLQAKDGASGIQKIQLALEYTGRQTWLGLGTSSNGYMVGSTAIIASPGTDEISKPPLQYTLTDQDIGGIHGDDNTGTLEDATITSTTSPTDISLFTTVLKFTKHVNDSKDAVPIVASPSTLNTFIYAAGSSRELNYHEHRGAFRIDVTKQCEAGAFSADYVMGDNDDVWKNYGTFAAHGFFATLAFGLCSPFAVTVAWFRTLVPASWIYIHVFANSLSAVLVLLSFLVAVVGVTLQPGAGHFKMTHHWVGLVLTLVVLVQVINGFLRPPVERKDARSSLQYSPTHGGSSSGGMMPLDTSSNLLCGVIAIPRTPRERWFFFHRFCGLAALAMGIYQIQSGLALYAKVFHTESMVRYYFVYVGLFFVSLALLKVWVTVEEEKARRGVAQAVSMTEPQPGDEDNGGEIVLGGFS
jgi:hypothetical protein